MSAKKYNYSVVTKNKKYFEHFLAELPYRAVKRILNYETRDIKRERGMVGFENGISFYKESFQYSDVQILHLSSEQKLIRPEIRISNLFFQNEIDENKSKTMITLQDQEGLIKELNLDLENVDIKNRNIKRIMFVLSLNLEQVKKTVESAFLWKDFFQMPTRRLAKELINEDYDALLILELINSVSIGFRVEPNTVYEGLSKDQIHTEEIKLEEKILETYDIIFKNQKVDNQIKADEIKKMYEKIKKILK